MRKDQVYELETDLRWFLTGMQAKFGLADDDIEVSVKVRVEPDDQHITLTIVEKT